MFSNELEPEIAGLSRPWPADQVERWPIERLKRYANNPRLHSEADLDEPIPVRCRVQFQHCSWRGNRCCPRAVSV